MRARGLQFEITANLFVVMLAGLGIVASVLTALAARTVEDAALDQLRTDARHLERMYLAAELTWSDLAAVMHTLPSNHRGVRWSLVIARGDELRVVGGNAPEEPEVFDAARAAHGSGVPVRQGGIGGPGLVLAVPLRTSGGAYLLVGSVSRGAMVSELVPLLASGAWVLATAAVVFVLFGAYLLRRRIVRPVQTLQGAMHRLAGGDLEVRTPDAGSDELADLARGFNQMAAALARDRMALVRAHESLSRSQRLATVGQLAAGVAHEVGNPVAAILGYAEVALRAPELSPAVREAANQIRAEALRVRSLVRELLDLARSSQVELSALAPEDLLLRAERRLRGQALLDGITLRVSCPLELAPVETDARRVEQILVNLIENAAHALAGRSKGEGAPDPCIELSAELGRLRAGRRSEDRASDAALPCDALAVTVTDNGPGIPAEARAHVFDPFFTTKGPGEGTGLGLWNAHRTAELLGGRIELESEPGCTRFRVLLPRTDTHSLKPDGEKPDGEAPRPDH